MSSMFVLVSHGARLDKITSQFMFGLLSSITVDMRNSGIKFFFKIYFIYNTESHTERERFHFLAYSQNAHKNQGGAN